MLQAPSGGLIFYDPRRSLLGLAGGDRIGTVCDHPAPRAVDRLRTEPPFYRCFPSGNGSFYFFGDPILI